MGRAQTGIARLSQSTPREYNKAEIANCYQLLLQAEPHGLLNTTLLSLRCIWPSPSTDTALPVLSSAELNKLCFECACRQIMSVSDLWFDEDWDESNFEESACNYIELWLREDGSVGEHHGVLPPNQVENWVNQVGQYKRSPKDKGGLRLLVGTTTNQRHHVLAPWPFSKKAASAVFQEFELMPRFFHACKTGNRVMTGFPSRIGSENTISWMLRQTFYAAAISYSMSTNTVRGVVIHPAIERDLIGQILKLKEYACHPMLIPLLVLAREVERLNSARDIDNKSVLEIESKTGLRKNARKDEKLFKEVDDAMREAVERLTMITNHRADAEILTQSFADAIPRSIDLIEDEMKKVREEAIGDGKEPLKQLEFVQKRMRLHSQDLLYQFEYISQSTTSIAASFKALQKRIKVQIEGFHILFTRRDNQFNLEMARDSRRDSSSMKTIAVITTVFLPGTFIGTVFGMPMVDYKPSQFWIYLAITIPLTILVMATWAAWMHWENRKNGNNENRAENGLATPLEK